MIDQEIADIIALAASAGRYSLPNDLNEPDGVPYAIIPEGYELKDLEEFLPEPRSIRALQQLHDAGSFIEYVKAFAEPGTMILLNRPRGLFRAILDYHEPAPAEATSPPKPRWSRHIAEFTVRETPEWIGWRAMSGRKLNLEQFSTHLDDYADWMHEKELWQAIAANFYVNRASSSITVSRSANNASAGFSFSETSSADGGGGAERVPIPLKFTLRIAPYVGGPTFDLSARFKYSTPDKQPPQVWYELSQAWKMTESALNVIGKTVAEGTGRVVLAGE